MTAEGGHRSRAAHTHPPPAARAYALVSRTTCSSVVIPRSIPFAEANRVQQAVWKRGYSTRLAGRDQADPGSQVVEFLQIVDELPDPSEVAGLEQRLEAVLTGKRVQTEFAGSGAWLETVQNRPGRRASA